MSFVQKSTGALFLAWFCLSTACGMGGSSGSVLVLTPSGPSSVALGETLQLNATRGGVIWNVIGSPETGTIDAFGLYQAPDTLPADPHVVILGQESGEETFAFVELTP